MINPPYHEFANCEQSEAFQEDIYPDTLSGEPSLTSGEWFSGHDASPRLVSMESVYRNESGAAPRQRAFQPLNTEELKITPNVHPPAQKPPEVNSSPKQPIHVVIEPQSMPIVNNQILSIEQRNFDLPGKLPEPHLPEVILKLSKLTMY